MADSDVPGTMYERPDRGAPRTTYETSGDRRGANGPSAEPRRAPSTVYEGSPADGAPQGRRRFLLPQPILDDFEYLRDLSTRGAQSNVVLCRRRSNGEDVVVKWYRDLVASFDVDAVEKLIGLARTPEGREHIAPIYDFRQWEGETWEVQEYFSNGSLEDLYQAHDGPIPRNLMRTLLEEVYKAIAFTHKHNIIHRDLSPANILVRRMDPLDVVLGDFGVAREQAASRVIGSVAGTMAYMSPEGSDGLTSRAADWWSLGVIVYQGLHGRHLFSAPDGRGLRPDAEIRVSLGQGLYEIEPTGDDHWDLLLRGLLSHDSERRWGEAELGRWLRGEAPAVHTRPVGPRTRVQAFPFRGENLTPSDLARSFREASEDAAQFLANPRNVDLLRKWLARHGLAEEAALIVDGQPGPGAAAVGLQVLMDPAETPCFAGRVLSNAEMARTSAAAVRGDTAAAQWIRRLREERVLTVWAQQVEDGKAILLADDSLQRWWQRITSLSAEHRQAIGAHDPAIEGLLLAAALDQETKKERERQISKTLSRIGDVNGTFRPFAEAAARDKDDSNFGVRAITANQLPVEQRSEKARRAAEHKQVRHDKRTARQRRNRQIRLTAFSNFRDGARGWSIVGAAPAAAALAAEWRYNDAGDAVGAVAPWFAGFVLLGGVLWALRPQQHPRMRLLLTALVVAWIWDRYLMEVTERGILLPSTTLWQAAFLALAVVGLLTWASTFLPRFSSPGDAPLGDRIKEAVQGTGRMQLLLWTLVMVALFQQAVPEAVRSFDLGFPTWYHEAVRAVFGWTSPVANLLPDQLLPWGATGVLLVTGVLRCIVVRHPLPVPVARTVLVLVTLILLVVIVAGLPTMAGLLLLVGFVLAVAYASRVLVALTKARTT